MYLHNPDVGLDPNFLPELGENPHVPPPPAPALNDSIAIQHGLPQEAFLAIWDSYQIPSHLPLLNPPLLNTDIMALVGNTQKTIDAAYVLLQRQCLMAITAGPIQGH
uniref:Uncharacterized protein n=1 Tax=Lygus hesperus TaxID=30085 RepID=A0A146L7B6_LYGHE